MELKSFIILVIAANVISFLMYGIDKFFAKNGMYRISEKALLLSALLMGGIGACAGMYTFRHKTKKPIFNIGVPVLIIFNIATVYYLYKYNLIK